MLCRKCGGRTRLACPKCGTPACPAHTHYHFDDANEAISRGAVAVCYLCHPQPPRPYTRERALARGEWWLWAD